MKTLRINGAEPGILLRNAVTCTRHLRDVIGMRLNVAKGITDDILDGIARDVEVPDAYADIHAKTLWLLGAQVEIVDPFQLAAQSA